MENNNRLSELTRLHQYIQNSIDRVRSDTSRRESFEDLDSKFRNEFFKETGSGGQYLRDLQITDRKQASLCRDAFRTKSTSKKVLRMRYDEFTYQFQRGIEIGIKQYGG